MLVVLAALATILVPALTGIAGDTHEVVTRETMRRLRAAITGPDGYRTHMQHAVDPTHPSGGLVGMGSGLPWASAATGSEHPQLHFLYAAPFEPPVGQPLFDPLARIGWNGPYVEPVNSVPYKAEIAGATGEGGLYGDPGNPGEPSSHRAPADAWGNPIVIQLPDAAVLALTPEEAIMYARLVSPGPNKVLDTPRTVEHPSAQSGECGDDVVAFLFVPDPNE